MADEQRDALVILMGTFDAIASWNRPSPGRGTTFAQAHIQRMVEDAKEIGLAAIKGEDVWAVVQRQNREQAERLERGAPE